jgi:hypothetical protein
MTEAEWLTAHDPEELLNFYGERISDRRLRLFCCACCFRVWKWLPNCARQLVTESEQAADDTAHDEAVSLTFACVEAYIDTPECRITETGCSAAYAVAYSVQRYSGEKWMWVATRTVDTTCNTYYWNVIETGSTAASIPTENCEVEGVAAEYSERRTQSNLLRDIIGNPFNPNLSNTTWLTPTVLALANSIYTERAFDRMPILADALEVAGCDNADILLHCREPGEHVRGCWVVDLILGKE